MGHRKLLNGSVTSKIFSRKNRLKMMRLSKAQQTGEAQFENKIYGKNLPASHASVTIFINCVYSIDA